MSEQDSSDQEVTPGQRILSRSNPHDVAHINDQRNKFAQLRDATVTEGTETERHLTAQLMLLTTVLLTANLAILGASELANELTLLQRVFVLFSFLALVISVVSGIKFYFAVMQDFIGWSRAKNEVVLLFDKAFEMTQDELGKKVTKLQDLPNETPRGWLYLQIGSLFSTLIFDFLLLVAFLFDWSFL